MDKQNKIKLAITAALAALTTACSMPPQEEILVTSVDDIAKYDNYYYFCTYEARTGSHIKKKVCYTKQEMEAMVESSKDYHRRVTVSGGAFKGEGGAPKSNITNKRSGF